MSAATRRSLPQPVAEAINAHLLQRSTQAALAAPQVPTTYDLAFAALVDWVELRARQMYPDRFTAPAAPAGAPADAPTE